MRYCSGCYPWDNYILKNSIKFLGYINGRGKYGGGGQQNLNLSYKLEGYSLFIPWGGLIVLKYMRLTEVLASPPQAAHMIMTEVCLTIQRTMTTPVLSEFTLTLQMVEI